MKKNKLGLLMLACLCSTMFAMTACEDKNPSSSSDSSSSSSSSSTGGSLPSEKQETQVVFKNGDTTVKTVTLEEGATLTETDIPEDASQEGYFFDGWYVGETKVEVGYEASGEVVTVEAKFTKGVTVAFKNGEETVKSVLLRPNTGLAEADYPADPVPPTNFAFDAWVNADDEVVDITEATFAEDTEIFASFTRVAYTVTFGETPVQVEKAEGVFKLQASQIPAGEVATDKAFMGWYTQDGLKAIADMEISSDMTFTAKYIAKADYVGLWIDETNKVILTVTDTKVSFTNPNGDDKEGEYTFDAVAGTLSADNENSSYPYDKITLSYANGTVTLTNRYYDEYDFNCDEDGYCTYTFTFTKAQPVDYAGSFRSGSTKLVITDGGIVTDYNGTKDYAKMTKNEGTDTYTIEYKASSYSSTYDTVTATFDAKGNIVIKDADTNAYNGLFIKNATDCSSYYDDDYENYVYFYTVEGMEDQVVVYRDKDVNYYYATIDGTWETNAVVTLTANDTDLVVKVVSSYKIAIAKAERGTYTGADGDIYLDGFGTATVGENTASYYFVGDVCVIGEKGYTFDGNAYTEAQGNGKAASFTQWDGSRTLKFDNFGGAVLTSYSTPYQGTYAYSQDGLTVTLTDTYYGEGDYTVAYDGNVLVGEDYIFVKDGYTVVTQESAFVGSNAGWWKNDADETEYVYIDTANDKITIDGETKDYDINFDGTLIEFYIYDSETYTSTYYDVTIENGKLQVVTSTYSETLATRTYTSAAEPEPEEPEEPAEKDAFEGVWLAPADVSYPCKLTFNGTGMVHVSITGYYPHEEDAEYTVEGNVATFYAWSETWTCTLNDDGTIKVVSSESYNHVFTMEVQPDAFAGTWEGNNTFYFDGFGNGKVNDSIAFTYTVDENGNAVFTDDTNDYVVSVKSEGVLTVNWDYYGESSGSYEVTLVSPFSGTWFDLYRTLVFNGDKVTISGCGDEDIDKEHTFTVDGNVATIVTDSVNYGDLTITIDGENMLVKDAYSSIDWTLTKQ